MLTPSPPDLPLKATVACGGRKIISWQKKEGGFVLLITLLVVLLLTLIIFEIDFQSRADLRAAGNFRDDLSAYYVARAGITGGKAILKDDLKNNGTVDSLGEFWAATAPPFPVGDGQVSGKIIDEAGKFNINTMLDANDQPIPFKKQQLETLFRLLSVDPILVDPMIDWTDKNDQTQTNGAENETYQTLEFPYPTKNGLLTTLEEMLYIKGITQEVYQKISPYLTVSTDGKINVNTADPLILQSIDPAINESDVEYVMKSIPYRNVSDFVAALPAGSYKSNQTFSALFSVRSDIFLIESRGMVRNTRKRMHEIWNRSGNGNTLYFRVE